VLSDRDRDPETGKTLGWTWQLPADTSLKVTGRSHDDAPSQIRTVSIREP